MKKYLALGLLGFVAVSAISAEESIHGQAPELKNTTAIAEILARPHAYEGSVVQVRGKITEVCKNMGCWLRVGDSDGAILLAKSTGDRITIPTDSEGRVVVVEGTVVVEHESSGDDESGDHDEHHDHGADAETYTCPTATVRLETRGVQLL